MRDELLALRAENAELKDRVAVLESQLTELHRRLGMTSANSSKPPSSDVFDKPKSLRKPSGKASGGQPGHKGMTLEMVAAPNHVEEHRPDVCGGCGLALTDVDAASIERRQVFDLPEPKVEVTEHRAVSVCCPRCALVTQGEFPKAVRAPVMYGAGVQAAAVYLSNWQLIPEDRLRECMADLFDLPISTATLATINREAAAILEPVQEQTLTSLKAAKVKHLDETSLRIGGKNHWLHGISHGALTHYRVHPKRGDLLDEVTGTIIHDCWMPYFTMENVKHGLCNAHILRELQARIEDKEPWAKHMQRLLRTLCHTTSPPVEKAFKLYDQIVQKGLDYHEAKPPLPAKKKGKPKRCKGHNLLLRLQRHQEDVLRFLTDPAVPFTNNQAERDIRMMKVKQKISGGFRSQHGAHTFCTIRGFLSSCRKQNLPPYRQLTLALA